MPLLIMLKVIPSSGKQKIVLDKNNMLKLYLKSPPEDGKANRELILFFKEQLKLAQDKIIIISGLGSRIKRIKIDTNISWQELLTILEIHVQTKLI